MSLHLPLKKTRVSLLSLIVVSSIIAGAAAVNSIRKFSDDKAAARHSVSSDVTVSIDTSDMENTIIVLFVVTTLLSMQSGNILLILVKDWFRPYWPPRMTHPRDGVAVSTQTLGLQSWCLLFNLCAILAVLIPATIFAADRMVMVKAFEGGIQLPDSAALAAESRFGIVGVYWNYFPVRFVIVSSWINVLFTLPTTLASFVALSYRQKAMVLKSDTLPPEAEQSSRAAD